MADKNENVLVEEKLPPPISLDKTVYSSEPFKFLVEGTPFYIHGNLLSKHSKALAACLSNPMKEKDQGFAVLEDVSESTFNHLLEWMYQDFYTVPAPIKVVKKKEIKENPEQQDHKLFPMDGMKSPEDEAPLEPRPPDVDEIDLSWGEFYLKHASSRPESLLTAFRGFRYEEEQKSPQDNATNAPKSTNRVAHGFARSISQ